MQIAILTTDTPHHIYFIREIANYFNICGIAVEKFGIMPPFDIYHSFEDEREHYEQKELLNENNESFGNYSETKIFDNINDDKCVNYIEELNPEVIITFGTGIISNSLIQQCPSRFLNLHGGDPQYYRGLDSHLWAIYHKDFSQLKVTLHRLNSRLDDGEIVQQDSIKINNQSRLYKLRADNTKVCVKLTISALNRYEQQHSFDSYPQKKIGRYYSFMPSVLKEICVENFNKYVINL